MPQRSPSRPRRALSPACCLFLLGVSAVLHGQQADESRVSSSARLIAELPDEPSPSADVSGSPVQSTTPQPTNPQTTPGTTIQTTDQDALSPNGTKQTKRILGVIPNFRSVSADIQLPPQSAKDKFLAAGHDSFDYGSFVLAAVQAGFSQNSDAYPEFHQGVVGYGRYYWHTLADTASENFMVGGVGPVAFHQDARFYTLGHGGFVHRAVYAATRILITRTDGGAETFNFSEIVGSGAASGISTLYYPTKYRTWTKVGQKWLTSDLIDAANFTFKEFWPDINKKAFRNRGSLGTD